MPLQDPYIFSGVVYDTDETVEADVSVTIENLTNSNETVSTTTNSSGEYTLNAVDFTTNYAHGDVIYVFARKGKKSEWYKTSINTATGSEEKNLYLNNGQLYWSADDANYRINSLAVTNDDKTDREVIFEDIAGEKILKVRSPAHTTLPGIAQGKRFSGAIRVLEEGTGGITPTTTRKRTHICMEVSG